MTKDRLSTSNQESASPTDYEMLDLEIAQGLDNARGALGFLDNFAAILPGGFFDKYVADSDLADKLISAPEDRSDSEEAQQSQRYKQATYGDFLSDRDTALVQAGIDLEELERLKANYKKAKGSESFEALNAYLGYALPVYKELRQMGYSHDELVG